MRQMADGVRFDAYPEVFRYEDHGCEVAPKCLECPLPVCRYTLKGGLRAVHNMVRDARIRERHAAHTTASAIAVEEGISLRTVYRVLAPV